MRFILFLLAYILWIFLAAIVSKKAVKSLVEGKYFVVTQLQLLLQIVFFFLFVYLISGFFEWKLVGLFALSLELGVILSYIIEQLFGSIDTKWYAHAIWAGGEYGLKNKWLMIMIMVVSLLITILYPIMVYRISPDNQVIPAFQYTILLFLSGSLVSLPVLIGALKSENLDEETRKRFFIRQLGTLLSFALYLSIAFWSFGISEKGIELSSLANFPIILSPALLIFLVSFFFLTVILPFLIGSLRSGKWQVSLMENQGNYLTKVFDTIDYPNTSQYIPQLEKINGEIQTELVTLSQNDSMIHYGYQMDKNQVAAEVASIAPAYQLSRNMDPRFNYMDWLYKFHDKINQIINDLSTSTTEADKLSKVKNWSVPLHTSKTELDEKIKTAKEKKAPVLITLGNTAFMLILSAVLSELGKWIFENIKK